MHPRGQSETKFFSLLGPPPIYQKSMPSKKVGMDYLFWAIFKMASKYGNHVLCHNLSSKAVRFTKLVSIHMFLGAGTQLCQ